MSTETLTQPRGRMVYVRRKGKTTTKAGVGAWHDKIKQQAVEMIMAGKTSREVSIELSVPISTIVTWRGQPWFKDTIKELQEDDGSALDAKMTNIMHNSLATIQDRLDSGDFVRDEKTGKIVRVPVKLRDANLAFNTLMDKRQILRKQPTKIVDNQTVNQQLQTLANEFKKFLGKSVPDPESRRTYVVEGEHVIIDPETGEGTWLEPDDNEDKHD